MAEEKILVRVQKLLDKANAEGTTDAERQLFLDKADDLMMKHGIEEAMLMASMSKEERRKPISEKFRAADANAPHWEKFRSIMRALAQLQRVRSVFWSNGDVMLIGFREDVEYVKMKWMNVYLHFSKTIDPTWDRSLTPEHNVYNYKIAGRQWQDIQYAAAMNGIDKPFHWFKPAYQRHCRFIGETPTRHTQRNFAYRESFAEAFKVRILSRVEELIEQREGMVSEAGALVAVKDLMTEVDEEYYRLFPDRRPMSPEEIRKLEEEQAERARIEEERHLKWLESLSPKERREYDLKIEREQAEAAKRSQRWWRNWEKQQAALYDNAGHTNGAASADKVDLSRNEGMSAANRKEL